MNWIEISEIDIGMILHFSKDNSIVGMFEMVWFENCSGRESLPPT